MYWGAGRECRYSGARRGMGSIRGHWGSPRGCRELLGCQGCRGVRSALGWQVDWEPNHIGPQSRVPSVPLVSLGD